MNNKEPNDSEPEFKEFYDKHFFDLFAAKSKTRLGIARIAFNAGLKWFESSSDIYFPKYGCGNFPMVGDLIEFGTRHKRYIVTSIDDEGPEYIIECGKHEFKEMSLPLMILIERHKGVI